MAYNDNGIYIIKWRLEKQLQIINSNLSLIITNLRLIKNMGNLVRIKIYFWPEMISVCLIPFQLHTFYCK